MTENAKIPEAEAQARADAVFHRRDQIDQRRGAAAAGVEHLYAGEQGFAGFVRPVSGVGAYRPGTEIFQRTSATGWTPSRRPTCAWWRRARFFTACFCWSAARGWRFARSGPSGWPSANRHFSFRLKFLNWCAAACRELPEQPPPGIFSSSQNRPAHRAGVEHFDRLVSARKPEAAVPPSPLIFPRDRAAGFWHRRLRTIHERRTTV